MVIPSFIQKSKHATFPYIRISARSLILWFDIRSDTNINMSCFHHYTWECPNLKHWIFSLCKHENMTSLYLYTFQHYIKVSIFSPYSIENIACFDFCKRLVISTQCYYSTISLTATIYLDFWCIRWFLGTNHQMKHTEKCCVLSSKSIMT